MKKYIAAIVFVFVVCCSGLAFGDGRDYGRGHSDNHGNGHGYYQHDNHDNDHHGYRHDGWGYGFYAPAVAIIPPMYPAYYPPVPRCRYIDVFDAWGNYMGQERICD